MKKMMPVFLILILVALGGLAIAGLSMKKTTSPAQTSNPIQTNTPTTQPATASGSYQSGMTLVISSPANGMEVATPNVTITGKTTPNAEVFVNDIAGHADSTGYFAISTSLDEGVNTIVVAANDSNGNSAEQEITVSYTTSQ